MNRFASITLVLPLAVAVASPPLQDKFVYPKKPLSPSGAAPSPKVGNGTAYESGALKLAKPHTLVLPDNAVVEKYEGLKVRFFLTKTQRCSGHPPVPMRFDKSRSHYGIAQRIEDGAVVVSTFGEWANRGGSARIRLVVMVPRDLKCKLKKGLHGRKSAASTQFSPADKALKRCYWYAGPRPKAGWKAIATSLHYTRFLPPR